MANVFDLFETIGSYLAALKQKKNRKEAQGPGQQDGSYDNAVQCTNRQQNIIFPFDGFDCKPMLHQSQKQQGQPKPNKRHAGNMGGCFSHQGVICRKSLPQADRNLVNGDADTDKTQAVTDPGIDGALSGCPVAFFGQLVGGAKQFLGVRSTHQRFVESVNRYQTLSV